MEETKVKQMIEMISIYKNTNLDDLEPEEKDLVKSDLYSKKQDLDKELSNLYESGGNPIDDADKIHSMEKGLQDIEELMERLSGKTIQEDFSEEEEEEVVEVEQEEIDETPDSEESEELEVEFEMENEEEDDIEEEDNPEEIEDEIIELEEETIEEPQVNDELVQNEFIQTENSIPKIFSISPDENSLFEARKIVDKRRNATIDNVTMDCEKVSHSIMKKIFNINRIQKLEDKM